MSKSERDKTASQAGKGPVALALVWFRRGEWPRLLASAADRDELEETYDDGCEARKSCSMTARGVGIEKVDVGVDELLAWCRHEKRRWTASPDRVLQLFKLQQSERRRRAIRLTTCWGKFPVSVF